MPSAAPSMGECGAGKGAASRGPTSVTASPPGAAPADGTACRRFLRAPGTPASAFPGVPTHPPDLYVQDITPPWYGLGGTG